MPKEININTRVQPNGSEPSKDQNIQFRVLSTRIKYNGNLCHMQNLKVKEDKIMNKAGIKDREPMNDNSIKSIPKLENIVPIRYIIANTHGINFKHNTSALYRLVFIIL